MSLRPISASPPNAQPPLRLELEFVRSEQGDDPFAFRFAAQDYLLRQEGGRFEVAHFDWSAEVQAELQAIRQPGREATLLSRFGGRLRTFLQGTSWAQQEAQLKAAVAAERSVVLTLRSAAAELYSLPWELLTLRDSGQHLGELPGVLLRYEWPGTRAAELAEAARIESGRILLAWSGAGGSVPAAEHAAAIRAALPAGSPLFVGERDILPNASYAALAATLQAARQQGQPIAVLQLLCHGSVNGQSFGLLLDGATAGDGSAWIDAGRLRQLLAPYANMLRLVVLCACDSGNAGPLGNQLGSLAQVLHRVGIPQVIASRYPLSVAGSLQFATEFYAQLLDRVVSSEQAFLAARRQLALDTAQIDWASLQLYQSATVGEDSRPITLRPYRGLLAFGPEQKRFFFGRDAEVAEILADAQALLESGQPRLLAIDGASGTGKSSVVFAGALSPLLAQLTTHYGAKASLIRLRPGRAPLAALAAALASGSDGDAGLQRPTLIVVDQLEELFTQTQDAAERQEFARRLWALATAKEGRALVLLTLRSDFVGHCGELVLDDSGLRLDRVIYQDGHRVSIARMSPAQLREVIERPAQLVGLRLQAGLLERMLHEVDSEAGALPLVADTLDLLWQRRVGPELTQQAYEQIGGVTGALRGRADQALAALSEAEQQQARRLLVRLGHGGSELSAGVRLRVSLAAQRRSAAAAGPASEAAAAFFRMLSVLVEARLLTVDRQGTEETVEVAHEALLRKWPTLLQWLKEDAQLLAELDLLDSWVRQYQQHQTLLSPGQLERAVRVRHSHPEAESAAAAELVQRSEEAIARAAERDRFARDCLRLLAVRDLEGDATRQVAILREAESRSPTAVPLWLPYAVDLLQSSLLMQAELSRPSAAIERLACSPDGRELVLACSDGLLAQVELPGGELRPLSEGLLGVSALSYSRDGASVLCGTSAGLTVVYPRAGATPPRRLSGHSSAITAVASRPQSPWLASASVDGTIRLWGPSDKCLTLSGPRGAARAIAFHPDGSLLVSAGDDGKLRVYNLASLGRSDRLDKPELLDEHEGPVRSLSFAAGGRYALSLGEDGTARLWDEEGEARAFGEAAENVSAAIFSADGQQLILGHEDGTIYRHELTGQGTPLLLLRGAGEVLSLAVSPDGAWLAASFDDDDPAVSHLHSRGQDYFLGGHLGAVSSLSFSPDSRYFITLCDDGKARVFDLARPGLYVPRPSPPESALSDFHCASPMTEVTPPPAFPSRSPDGKWELSVERGGLLRWRQPGAPWRSLPAAGGPLSALRFTPDSRYLVTVATDGQTRLWRLDDGAGVGLPGHRGALGGLDVRRDGRRLVLGGPDGKLRLYTLTGDGSPLAASLTEILEGHRAGITLAAFAPEGETLLSMSQDGSTRLWREAGRCEILIEGEEDSGELEEFGVAVSRDFRQLITQRRDGLRLLWQLDLDPSALIARLWQASTFCLSAAERQRYLREPSETAAQLQAESQRRASAARPR